LEGWYSFLRSENLALQDIWHMIDGHVLS